MKRSNIFKYLQFFALVAFCLVAPVASTWAASLITQPLADNGQVAIKAPFYQDETGARSVVQASIEFRRLQQSNQLQETGMLNFGTEGQTYWFAMTITNNSRLDKWRLELVPQSSNKPLPIRSISIYNPSFPDKPSASWPNMSSEGKQIQLPVTLAPGQTTTRYVLVETWPGLDVPMVPVLKTSDFLLEESQGLAQKITLLWLVMGAVFGAGLVQLILTRQGVQGMLALNGLLLALGIFITQRPDVLPGIANFHPVLLPLTITAILGIGASGMLWVVSRRYGSGSLLAVLPLFLNIAALLIATTKIDMLFTIGITVESLPGILLSVTGLALIGISIFLGAKNIELIWFVPAWMALTAMDWLGARFAIGAPISYALLLTVGGIASVFNYWKSMDKETEALQRRLRKDLKNIQDKLDEQTSNWEKKLSNERLLLNELRQREQQRSAELDIARKEADAANKAKSDFLAIISHEIRTPMNGIMGIMQLIDQTPLNEKQREYVEVVKNSGDTMVTLLNDILDYSKIEKGAIDIENIAFTLRNLVNSVATLMSGRAKDKGVGIDVKVDDDVPDSLLGDPNRIRQVLLNLVGNAIKFTEKGGVTIHIKRSPDSVDEKVQINFEIVDTGIGISEEGKAKLFKAYAQADASISRRFGGTGLGLNICRMLVSAMGGDIGVNSTEGKGSTFWFTLPLTVTSILFSDARKQITTDYRPTKKISILVIDDNAVNLKIVAGLLDIDGHTITSSNSGEKALQLVESNNFDLIFVDLLMPGMDGRTFCTKLRKNPHPVRSHIPVYALTGLATDKERQEVRDAGMQGLIPKPVTQQSLRAVIETIATRDTKSAETVQDVIAKLGNFTPEDIERLRGALLGDIAAVTPTTPVVAPPVIAEPVTPQVIIEEPQPIVAPIIEEKPIEATKASAIDAKLYLNFSMLGELKNSLPTETLQEIFQELIDKSKEIVEDLEEGAKQNDYDDIGEKAHNLKGMAGNFGLEALMKHAGEIEELSRKGDNKKAAELALSSRPILDNTLIVLDQWIKS